MPHNYLHYVNMDLTNDLGYRSIIYSEGILTDFVCPEPGKLGKNTLHTVLLGFFISNLSGKLNTIRTKQCL